MCLFIEAFSVNTNPFAMYNDDDTLCVPGTPKKLGPLECSATFV